MPSNGLDGAASDAASTARGSARRTGEDVARVLADVGRALRRHQRRGRQLRPRPAHATGPAFALIDVHEVLARRQLLVGTDVGHRVDGREEQPVVERGLVQLGLGVAGEETLEGGAHPGEELVGFLREVHGAVVAVLHAWGRPHPRDRPSPSGTA